MGLLGLKEFPTPIDLGLTGLFLPKCYLYIDFLAQSPLPRSASTASSANWVFYIHCLPCLVGLTFYAQVAIIDSAAAKNWMTTNAYEGKIGLR